MPEGSPMVMPTLIRLFISYAQMGADKNSQRGADIYLR
jgi:hypothetical protein